MTGQSLAKTRYWHPFADMGEVSRGEFVVERGQGVWVFDGAGNRYLDATASLWNCFIGHGRAELAEAARLQMETLASYSNFGDLATRPTLELAEKVAGIGPVPEAVVFFTCGGSESIDTAAKLARRYWNTVGKPEKRVIVVRDLAYHGMAGFGTSLSGIKSNASGYGPLIQDVLVVAPDDTVELERLFDQRAGDIAAFVGEPVRGAGGIYPPRSGYWTEVERLCRKYDVLLICDEVVTGFGRLDQWFASARFGVVPDMVVGAKGMTSGYLPLGVVICGLRVQEPFWNGAMGIWRHGYTYSGHAAACAVGLANLKLMEEEKVIEHGAEMGAVLAREIEGLRGHPLVREVRSIGTLAAIELSHEARKANHDLANQAVMEARRKGVITRSLMGHSLHISPPLVINPDEIRFMVERFADALDALAPALAGVRGNAVERAR